ncbi:hypothetical protein LXL04_006626 [Taraxacum kok-saghyz]
MFQFSAFGSFLPGIPVSGGIIGFLSLLGDAWDISCKFCLEDGGCSFLGTSHVLFGCSKSRFKGYSCHHWTHAVLSQLQQGKNQHFYCLWGYLFSREPAKIRGCLGINLLSISTNWMQLYSPEMIFFCRIKNHNCQGQFRYFRPWQFFCWFGARQVVKELSTRLHHVFNWEAAAVRSCRGHLLQSWVLREGQIGPFLIFLPKWQFLGPMRKRTINGIKKMKFKVKNTGANGIIMIFHGCWDLFCNKICLFLNKLYCNLGPILYFLKGFNRLICICLLLGHGSGPG